MNVHNELSFHDLRLGEADYQCLCSWPFEDDYVVPMLKNDIPDRVRFQNGRILGLKDSSGQLVAFGTLDVVSEYSHFSGGRDHVYIPLLATNPSFQGRGYGKILLLGLIEHAKRLRTEVNVSELLFLDVYSTNERAIALYLKAGFQKMNAYPIPDVKQDGAMYEVMALNLMRPNS